MSSLETQPRFSILAAHLPQATCWQPVWARSASRDRLIRGGLLPVDKLLPRTPRLPRDSMLSAQATSCWLLCSAPHQPRAAASSVAQLTLEPTGPVPARVAQHRSGRPRKRPRRLTILIPLQRGREHTSPAAHCRHHWLCWLTCFRRTRSLRPRPRARIVSLSTALRPVGSARWSCTRRSFAASGPRRGAAATARNASLLTVLTSSDLLSGTTCTRLRCVAHLLARVCVPTVTVVASFIPNLLRLLLARRRAKRFPPRLRHVRRARSPPLEQTCLVAWKNASAIAVAASPICLTGHMAAVLGATRPPRPPLVRLPAPLRLSVVSMRR